MNKKAMTPLVATLLLVVFALLIGTATMNWGKSYVEKIDQEDHEGEDILITPEDIDTPLKEIQIEHLTGDLTQDQYLSKEKDLIT